jgi:hypothetical protein
MPKAVTYDDGYDYDDDWRQSLTDDEEIGVYVPEFTTKKKLKDFCNNHIINEDIFNKMDEQMPPGSDILEELGKYCDLSKQTYIKQLLRQKKINTL